MPSLDQLVISGRVMRFIDGSLTLPSEIDLDNPDDFAAIKLALKVSPIFRALNLIHMAGRRFSRSLRQYFSDELICECTHLWSLHKSDARCEWPDAVFELMSYINGEYTKLVHQFQLVQEKKHKSSKREGYVYLLRSATGAYKIGRTSNPDDRIKTFEIKLPFEVEYEHTIRASDMYQLERDLHDKFSDQRINGEWFILTDRDIEYIKSIEEGS